MAAVMWQQRAVALGRRCRCAAALQAAAPAALAQGPLVSEACPELLCRRSAASGAGAGAGGGSGSGSSGGGRASWPHAAAGSAAALAAAAAAGGAYGAAACEANTEASTSASSSSSGSDHFLNVQGLSGHYLRNRTVAAIIGLPLRGKGHMARELKRYLEFFHGFEVEIFDVNRYDGAHGKDGMLKALKTFFEEDPAARLRQNEKHVKSGRFAIICASDTNDARASMWSGYSKWRRRWMTNTLESELQAHTVFVEVQVDDTEAHRKEYMDRLERARGLFPGALSSAIKLFEQDYVTIQSDGTEDDLAYMKMTNYNHKVVNNRMMRSFIGSRIAQFLTSVHPYQRTVYLTRHGESEYNVQKKLGGDSGLSPLGREYAPRLAEFSEYVVCRGAQKFACVTVSSKENKAEKLKNGLTRIPRNGRTGAIFAKNTWGDGVQEGMQLVRIQLGYGSPFEDAPATVEELAKLADSYKGPLVMVFVDQVSEEQIAARLWTSSLRRTKETARHIRHPVITKPDGTPWTQMAQAIYRNIDEVYAGEFEGLTYEEIKKLAPAEANLRKLDKLGYRYPRGESYYDVIARLDLPMNQLETYHEPIVVIGHQAIHRMVYAFLTGKKREHATDLSIPLHTVIKLEFDGTGAMQETRYFLGPKMLDDDDGQMNF